MDRLIPLWSQALLQVSQVTAERRPCLAVVVAPRIAERSARKVLEFAAEFAPNAGAGVMDLSGFRRFRGPHLEGLDTDPDPAQRMLPTARRRPANLFSDLNQWMLKVVLAPEVPAELLAAPRDHYSNATTLAAAAGVSVMTAFRLVEQHTFDLPWHLDSAPSGNDYDPSYRVATRQAAHGRAGLLQ